MSKNEYNPWPDTLENNRLRLALVAALRLYHRLEQFRFGSVSAELERLRTQADEALSLAESYRAVVARFRHANRVVYEGAEVLTQTSLNVGATLMQLSNESPEPVLRDRLEELQSYIQKALERHDVNPVKEPNSAIKMEAITLRGMLNHLVPAGRVFSQPWLDSIRPKQHQAQRAASRLVYHLGEDVAGLERFNSVSTWVAYMLTRLSQGVQESSSLILSVVTTFTDECRLAGILPLDPQVEDGA